MKAVVYLFSFWLLLLTGLPCPDADCHTRTDNTASSALPGSAEDHEEDHKAPCSPFCHCTICPGFSIPKSPGYVLPATPNVTISARQTFVYQSPSHADVAFAIWQPPKL